MLILVQKSYEYDIITHKYSFIGITHRDLKTENLMLDHNSHLKVIDYGLATTKITTNSLKGTPGYAPFEVLNNSKYTGSCVDMFAAGVILFNMVTGLPPFMKASPQDPFYKPIANVRADLFWKIHDETLHQKGIVLSEDVKDLIVGLWQLDPVRRFSLSETMNHSWYQDEISTIDSASQEFR